MEDEYVDLIDLSWLNSPAGLLLVVVALGVALWIAMSPRQ